MNWNFGDPKLVCKHFPRRLFCKIVNTNYAKSTEIKWSYSLKRVYVHHKIKLIIKNIKIFKYYENIESKK